MAQQDPMAYEFFKTDRVGEVLVVRAIRDLDHGTVGLEHDAEALGEELRAIAATQAPMKLLVDLSLVKRFTAEVVSAVISVHQQISRAGGRVKLCATGKAEDFFYVMGRGLILDVGPSVDELLADF